MLDVLIHRAAVGAWIFGGCCSNVYALEAIIKDEPGSGLLITFAQFMLTALFTWPQHFSPDPRRLFLKSRAVPLLKWLPNICLFFAVNLLNNHAFSFKISVPVHIILRSGGSILTMLVGYLWGKRYSRLQVTSVVLLTTGIIIAAMADAQAKGQTTSNTASASASSSGSNREFLTGLLILLIAQLLSAIMGLYVQITYAKYGAHWHENLFYSHALSIPLFLPFYTSLSSQFHRMLTSAPIILSPAFAIQSLSSTTLSQLSSINKSPISTLSVPSHILTLIVNALTQFACIRGVNMLASRTSAVGVSVALNLRKLVSLFISIKLFGNILPLGVKVGAVIVFASAGFWAWDERRVGNARKKGTKEDEKVLKAKKES